MKILLALLVVFLVILLGILILLLLKTSKKTQNKPQPKPTKAPKESEGFGLKKLVSMASVKSLSKKELSSLIDKFLELEPIKDKHSKDDQELFLTFILLVASNKNADAKIIAHLSAESKKRNPFLATQIDDYESMGLETRK